MTAIAELCEFVLASTQMFRKGEEVEAKGGAIHIYAMPHVEDARTITVDVHFVVIGFTEHAADKPKFVELLKACLNGPGEFCPLSTTELLGGPSYMTLGGWLGSQDMALRFIALGSLYELWTVFTPERIGMTGEMAEQMAGSGMVMPAPSAALKEVLSS